MKFLCSLILIMISSFMLTVTLLPSVGWSEETGGTVIEAGLDRADDAVEAQKWLDFVILNSEKLFSLAGVIVAGVFGLALLVRAQLKLWRADAAGSAVTDAVERSGSAPAVRAVMDAAPRQIKNTVKRWLK